MANRKINELSPRTPSLTDLMIVGDPSTGYSFKATLAALNSLIVNTNVSINDLNGVVITSPTNGQALVYDGTNWVNQSISVPVTSVFGRTGVVVATEGDYTLTQLGDVTLTSPSSNQVLQYNGTAWVNATLTDNGITSLNGLTAVSQTFATGSSGTDFAITSTTSTHTFNLPTASAVNRGALSSADWSTFNSKVGGSGTSGQVAYWTGTSSQSGSNNLFWDNANGRLGIGTNAPAVGLEVRNGANIYTSGASANGHYLEFISTSNVNGYVNFRRTGNQNGDYAYQLINNSASFRANSGTGEVSLFATSGGYFLNFYSGGTEAMRIFSTTRNVLIQNGGTFTDGGQRLQVTGDVLISHSAASGTYFEVKRASTTDRYFRVLASGNIEASSVSTADPNFQFLTGANNTSTTGDRRFFWLQNNFSPTSGTATYRTLELTSTINQTGGANGITRGLYVNPTLTAAADWRSIEWSNNSGWGLYGAGTANNYLAGSLGIGSTTLTNYTIRSQKTITGGVAGYGIMMGGQIQSDVTSVASYYRTAVSTQAASFTLSDLHHFYAEQGTFGASSAVTNQYGFVADASLIGATNNFGFRGNIPSGTGRWNLYMNGTAANYLAGNFSIATTNTPRRLNISQATGSTAASIGIYNGGGTLYSLIGIESNVTNDLQFASNAGIRFYSGSTLGNIVTDPTNEVMRLTSTGNLLLGTTTDAGYKLDVNGTARFTGNLRFDANMRDNRDNTVIEQSASGIASNRDFTIGNGLYGRMMFTSKQYSFTNGTHTSLGAYGFYYNGETNTGAGAGTSIYFKAQTPTAANSNGGNFIIELPSGTGTGRQGSVIIGGTSPNASAILDLTSTTKGFLPPRGTNAQMLAITGVAGLVFYDTTNNKLNVYDGTNWVAVH